MAVDRRWERYRERVRLTESAPLTGRVTGMVGLVIEARGPRAPVGELCRLLPGDGSGEPLLAEVAGFREGQTMLMPLGSVQGLAPGWEVRPVGQALRVGVGPALLGRVLDGLGRPADDLGPVAVEAWYPVDAPPPDPLSRPRISQSLGTGVRAVDGLLTLGRGQRLGIFAGSGIGKSTLLSMMARGTAADVNVIGLIGERGREVREFIEGDLGAAGLARSVVVMATSDQAPLLRIKGALVATAVAEYFRDQGKDVLLMIDSVTRLAMAQREVGLAVGEPPATRGYTPSVFALLPRLLERSGTAPGGSITGLYTVLVEGDDMNEPVADAVRGILDGHLVLSRRLAAMGQYPAVDPLVSVSRLMAQVARDEHRRLAAQFRSTLAVYREHEDLVSIGAYQAGSHPALDRALHLLPGMIRYLNQDAAEQTHLTEAVDGLRRLLGEG